MRRALLAAFLVLALPAQAAPWSLAGLMAALAKNRQGNASFEEKKFISVLDEPVASSGELRFAAPDHLEKITLEPHAESLVLDGDRLTLERRGRKKVVALGDYPEIAGMIESIRATLAGDRKALERVYHLTFTGSSEAWDLTLIPLDARIAKVVARVRMHGAGDQVRKVEILQADGDRSLMTIRKLP